MALALVRLFTLWDIKHVEWAVPLSAVDQRVNIPGHREVDVSAGVTPAQAGRSGYALYRVGNANSRSMGIRRREWPAV